jgi:hypothetical protein
MVLLEVAALIIDRAISGFDEEAPFNEGIDLPASSLPVQAGCRGQGAGVAAGKLFCWHRLSELLEARFKRRSRQSLTGDRDDGKEDHDRVMIAHVSAPVFHHAEREHREPDGGQAASRVGAALMHSNSQTIPSNIGSGR